MAISAVIGALRVNLGIDTAAFRDGLKGASKSLDRLGKRMQRVGQNLSTALTAPLTIIGGLSLKAFSDFEKGLIGVGKTTGVVGKELEALGRGVQNISKRVPVATTRLLAMAQVAGQLGVRGNANILKFTETIGKLDLATSNFSGEEAASSLARILTLTRTSVGEVDRLASTFVRAGNDFNATESEINEVALRVAQATTSFDLSASAVVGIATALREVGVKAERGGTAIQKTFFAIDAAVRQGGEALTIFSRLTGQTAEQFRELAQESPERAFEEFIKGLEGVKQAGGDLQSILDALGLAEVRTLSTLTALASSQGLLSERLRVLNQAYQENRALNEEAAAASEAFDAQVRLTRNAVEAAAVALGRTMAPAANRVLTIIRELANAFASLSPQVQRTIAIIGGIAATIGPGLIALGLLTRGLVMGGAAVATFGRIFAAFGRLFATVVRDILASIGLLIGATSGMVGAFLAATAAILTAWVAFKDTMIAVAREIIMGIRDWLVTRFNSLVAVPFKKLLNDLTMSFPKVLRDALDLEPLPLRLDASVETASIRDQIDALDRQLDKVQAKILVETDPKALAQLNAQGEALIDQIKVLESIGVDASDRIATAFQGDLDRIGAKFDKLVEGIKSKFPEGLVDAVSGDANNEEVLEQVKALDKIKSELDELRKVDISDLGGGGAGLKKLNDRLAEIGETASTLPPKFEDVRFQLQQTGADIGRDISAPLKDALRGGIQDFGDFTNAMVRIAQNLMDRLLDVLFRPLENALADLFAQSQSGGGGGLLGGLLKVFGVAAGAAAGGGGGGSFGAGTAGAGTFFSTSTGGFQHGGSFTVGGVGGIDRNLVAFRASRGERVDITPAGQSRERGGGETNVFIDATGADPAQLARVEATIRETLAPDRFERRAVAAVVDAKHRGHSGLRGQT